LFLASTKPRFLLQLASLESLTVLGITFNSKLRFQPHISYITHSAARCLYGLKTLRAHGLAGKSPWDVPAWWGFLNAAEKGRIESVINKVQRYGYLSSSFENVHGLVDNMESKLFNCILSNPRHVFYQLLPPEKEVVVAAATFPSPYFAFH